MKKAAATSKGQSSTAVLSPIRRVVSPKELLLPYQRRWVDDPARFKIGAMSRQTGKSFGTAEESTEDSLSDPGTKWVCLSAGERQALEWLEKAKEWSEVYKFAINSIDEDRDFGEALLKQAEIRFANGSRVIAIPANPKTARGYSANIVLDEFAYHEDPDKIWNALLPSITNPLSGSLVARYQALVDGKPAPAGRKFKVRVVSTFNGRGNKFFDLWEKADQNGYSKHLVTIYDAVKDGLDVDIEELRKGLDNDEAWAQEFECVPMDTSTVLLPYELIARAESAEATEHNAVPDNMNLELYCGIDFGRQNDPSVCWTLQRMGDVLWTREVLVLKATDTPAQQAILESRIRAARRVSFDYTGPGIGLGDYLVRDHGKYDPTRHEFGKVELCTFTQAFKRLIFPRLRKLFEEPVKIRVPIGRTIREDLHAMQQTSKNGQYDYWAPHTRDGHSDRCTALALAVRAAGEGAEDFGVY